MASSLVATQLGIPPQTQQLVRRDRLAGALKQHVPRFKLTLLVAPAGYGKTTALVQWAHASQLPVAWVTLSEAENDLERLLRYLLTAWDSVQPGVAASPLGLLLGAMGPERDAALTAFVNVAADVPEHTVFVLDDYHLIEDETVHQALTYLLDHLPPRMHLVLASREEPPLPLARYRARQELLELRVDELRFLHEETAELLNGMMGLGLTDDQIAAVQADLEGWVAGLQLFALSGRRHPGTAEVLTITGRQRFIADYLSEDVLALQPDDVRRFLLETSILDRLSSPLCDAVTGRNGSQAMLERLERANLFLVPLDDTRVWYRFHRVFADFLRVELTRRRPDEVNQLHRRAARWYLAQELPEAAFAHAVAGDDPELVSLIIERYVNIKLNSGELTVVGRWLDALPESWPVAYPMLSLARAGLLAFMGAFEDCMRTIDDIEQRLTRLETDDTRWQLALVTAVRCFIACILNDLPRAEALADQALRDLRDESRSFRAGVYHALGDTYRRNGRWEEAKACYLQVPIVTDAPGFRVQSAVQSAHVFGALADLELRQGRLRAAAGYWRKALAAIQQPESWGRVELPVIGWVFIRMGELLYERNELAEAWEHLSRGLERAELGGDVRSLIGGYLIASRLRLTEGDVGAAAGYLERARALIEQAPFPEWTGRFERNQLELWLAQDRLRAAVTWADRALEGDALLGEPEWELAQLALARVLIVKGDLPARERALALLGRLSQVAAAEGRLGVQIEALALQALAHWHSGDRPVALTALERALRLAEPEGYIRLFADLGLPMARLLQEARSRDVLPDYVDILLAACGPSHGAPSSQSRALPEPLTDREQEILELLAAGLTNREIASTLTISPETVKKHTGNIYGKLGARTRTEAVARARALALLR